MRPPHVSPPALSGAASRRPTRFALAALAAGVLALAGCGGATVEVPEVPSPYADATIPNSADAPPAATGSSDSAGGSATPTPTPTATASGDSSGATGSTGTTPSTTAASGTGTSTTGASGTGGATTGTNTASSGGGAAAPSGGTDSQSNDTPPPAGSNAQKFEDFCAQNPGAC